MSATTLNKIAPAESPERHESITKIRRTRSCQRTRNGKLLTKSWVRVSADWLFGNGGPFAPLSVLNGT